MKILIKRKQTGGFTLVEMLLALGIGAIISASLYNIFWSAMKLDIKLQGVHDGYMKIFMADQAMTHDLENALTLDFSASYPGTVVFEGVSQGFSFLTQTPSGIKRIHYYSGQPDALQATTGRLTNPSHGPTSADPKAECLIRQESNLADWLNETSRDSSTQVVVAGLKKGSFACRYAPFVKSVQGTGVPQVDYQDSWDAKGLPASVSCRFTLYDDERHQEGPSFQRDIFLAPVPGYHE